MKTSPEVAVGATNRVAPSRPTWPWFKILALVLGLLGSVQTLREYLLPAFQLDDSRFVLLVLAAVVLAVSVVVFLALLKAGGMWSALFVLVTGNALSVLLAVVAYPDPQGWILGVLWVGPVLFAGFAYFWEWSRDREGA